MATLPKNPDALTAIFTDPDTPAASLFYRSINGVTVNWAGGLPTDADNGQVYYEYGPFANGLKIRFFQYGATYPLRYDFTGVTEKLAVNQQKLIGTIPVVVSDGVNNTDDNVEIWMDGKTAFVPTAPPGTMSAPTVTTVSSVAVSADMAGPPTPGDAPILGYKIRYSSNGGTSWTVIVDPFDPHTISGLPANTLIQVQSLAYNIVGDGPWSASGSATTNPASGSVSNQTIYVGSKTRVGDDGARPFTDSGVAVDLSSYNSLVGGSLGAYTPVVSGGKLSFTGAVGGPNGAVLRCGLAAGGTVDLTITTVANSYHVATQSALQGVIGLAVLGDNIYIRDGSYNATAARWLVGRNTVPGGTWTGSNYITIAPEIGGVVIIGAIETPGNSANVAQYTKWTNIDFRAPLTANTSDGRNTTTAVGAIFNIAQATDWVALENCRVGHTSTVNSLTTGVYTGIRNVGSTNFVCRNNVIDGAVYGISSTKADAVVENNTLLRIQVDALVISGPRSKWRYNTVTEKCQQAQQKVVLGVTTGSPTIITVDDAGPFTLGEAVYLIDMGGLTLVQGINGSITAKTATTLTVNIDTTGQTWTSGGSIGSTRGLHGDYWQMPDSMTFDGEQDDMEVIGNRFWPGSDTRWLYDGQGQAGSGGTVAAIRRRLKFIGNITVCTVVQGSNFSNCTDGLFASNTTIRQLGLPSGPGSVPRISVTGTNNTVVDNVACNYNLPGAAVNLNNVTLTVTNPNALPSNATDVATYEAAFVNPETVGRLAMTYAELVAGYAPKTGGPLDLAVKPGAVGGAYNQATGIYTTPR